MEFLLNLDTKILLFINKGIANPLFDKLFVLLTIQEHWYIVYSILIYFLLTKFQWKGRIFLVVLLVAIFVADQLSSNVIKELVGRIRPCHTLQDLRLLVPCGGGKSFPSSHAVNNFAFAILLSYFFQQYKIHFLVLASLVSLSRIYVGVHYPSDVIAGAIIGIIIGFLFVYIHKKVLINYVEKFVKKNES
ncbi:MAG: phosphatase PAP2 family protein [Ignavibacteria bacterium]|nr:phosphatase PAP2 family protein [Ignavibacteria bacterium]